MCIRDSVIRVVGGAMYLGGMLVMAWNVWKTVVSGHAVTTPVPSALAHA